MSALHSVSASNFRDVASPSLISKKHAIALTTKRNAATALVSQMATDSDLFFLLEFCEFLYSLSGERLRGGMRNGREEWGNGGEEGERGRETVGNEKGSANDQSSNRHNWTP